MDSVTFVAAYKNMLYFDPLSQESVFCVMPYNGLSYTEDKFVKCCGNAGVYEEGMPIELTGRYNSNTQIFKVDECSIYTKTYDHSKYMLEHISKQLSDSEKSEIIAIAENDVVAFAFRENAVDMIFNILKKYRIDEESDTKKHDEKRTKSLAKKVCSGLKKLAESDDLSKLLMTYQMPIDRINAIAKDNIGLNAIKKNSYLTLQTHGIDFRYVDLFSFNHTPVREYSPARLRGIVYESLIKTRDAGHTFCLLRQLVKRADYIAEHYGIYHTKFNRALTHTCIVGMDNVCQYHSVCGKQILYLNHVWEEETTAIQHLKRLLISKRDFSPEHGIDEIEKELNIKYNSDQRMAFNILNSSGVKILTGPPGSGKTSIIKGLIRAFEKNRSGKIKLAATTGRAAKVMAKACGKDAETVHKMLNIVPYGDRAKGRDLNNPVDADLIIVDEVSMLGLQLFSILLQAIKSDAILILVGDEDQLQSVDYGNVLHDLVASQCIEVFRLTEVVRQGGFICLNAQAINNGGTNLLLTDDFEIVSCEDENMLWEELSNRYIGTSSQILCPVRHGPVSLDSINYRFADQTERVIVQYGRNVYRLHSKIIMNKTDYNKGYVNGDIGYIVDVAINNDLVVEFDEKTLILTRQDLPNMALATAITIHKSQGSECDNIHIVLSPQADHMMSRRLIYTAITRARKKVTIYDMGGSLSHAMENLKEKPRQTALCERCRAELGET